jgi:hypothetical protein
MFNDHLVDRNEYGKDLGMDATFYEVCMKTNNFL